MKSLMKLIVLTTLIIFSSCKKDPPIDLPPPPSLNITNPFAEIGNKHKEILDAVAGLTDPAGMDLNALRGFISDEVDGVYPGGVIPQLPSNPNLITDFQNDPIQTLYDNGVITQKERTFLLRIESELCCPETIDDILKDMVVDVLNPTSSPFSPLPSLTNNNTGTTVVEGTKILFVIALARKSLQYWKNQENNNSSIWRLLDTNNQQLSDTVIELTKADVKGALFGLLVSKITTSSVRKAVLLEGTKFSAFKGLDIQESSFYP